MASNDDNTVVIPDGPVWDDSDDLTVADAPEVNGTADQTGGLGPL